MRDVLFIGSTWCALRIPVTFISGFQSLALRILKQPLRWAPLLPEARSLLRLGGRVWIIPWSLTCTRHNPCSGLSSLLLIVKLVLLFPPSFLPFSLSRGGIYFSMLHWTIGWTRLLGNIQLYWLTKIKFSKMGESASLFSVSLWNGSRWYLCYRLSRRTRVTMWRAWHRGRSQ